MGKKRQDASLLAGRQEIEIPVGPISAMEGVLEYFAILAYPDQPEQRPRSFEALDQWRNKVYIRQHRNHRHIRRLLRPDAGWMDNETTGSMVDRTIERIKRRLRAGSSAYALYCDGLPMFAPNPTTYSGMGSRELRGMRSIEQCMRYLADEQLGPEKEIVHDKQQGAHKRLTDNNRTLVWNESLPVLHLAVTLHLAFERLSSNQEIVRLTGVARRTRSQNEGTNLADDLKLFTLLHNWLWLRDAVESAEWWRLHLSQRVPFTDAHPFDPDKAIILRPVLLNEEPADE